MNAIRAKFRSSCPCCPQSIRVNDDIVVADGVAVHEACYSIATDAPVVRSYMTLEAATARHEAARVALTAAQVAKAAKAAKVAARSGAHASGMGEGERGSFGGSQLAEDMGDYSGRR